MEDIPKVWMAKQEQSTPVIQIKGQVRNSLKITKYDKRYLKKASKYSG